LSGSENLAKVGVSLFPSLQAAVGQVRGPTIAFVRIDVVPHIAARGTHQRRGKISFVSQKGLFQQYPPEGDISRP
jgi:hypothetical protein